MKIQVLTLIITFLTLEVLSGQSIDQNYVKSTDYKEGFTTTTVSNATSEQKIESIQYLMDWDVPSKVSGSQQEVVVRISSLI